LFAPYPWSDSFFNESLAHCSKKQFMKTNRSKSVNQSELTGRNGFTRLDLLVVLGTIAVLIALALPALAGTKTQTKIGACADNVRKLALACQIYAGENNDRLPVLSGSGSWAWDLPASAANALLNSGAKTNDFYCPGTSPRFTDQDNWMASGGSSLWHYGEYASFHIVGYSLTFSGQSTLTSTNQNTTMLPETIKSGLTLLSAPAASDRVLLADATLSIGSALPGYAHPENNYASIQGGFYKPHVSPHLRGNIPAGGNIGFKDGHVDWRKFELMVPRTAVAPAFWW
jgi:type II secretory pathway pseudopilin PulG